MPRRLPTSSPILFTRPSSSPLLTLSSSPNKPQKVCVPVVSARRLGLGAWACSAMAASTPQSPHQQHQSSSPFVEYIRAPGGLDKVLLRGGRSCSVEIRLFGGQVTSWKNDHGEELLFVSSKANFKPPKALRGGIPICFPQFGSHGNLEQHGFARNRLWTIDDNPPPLPVNPAIKAFVDIILKPTEDDLKMWPHSFEFRLRIALGALGDLSLTSRIRNTNTDGRPFSYTFAYHTYFSVSDISEVRVEGLETMDYLDLKKERCTEQGDAIVFESEVDKVYLSTPPKVAIIDHEKKRTFVVTKEGLPDVVVWNPWDKKAKAMQDFGDSEYKHMLCVEPAAVEKPITLKPGEEWKGRVAFSAVPSSYCSGQLDPLMVLHG